MEQVSAGNNMHTTAYALYCIIGSRDSKSERKTSRQNKTSVMHLSSKELQKTEANQFWWNHRLSLSTCMFLSFFRQNWYMFSGRVQSKSTSLKEQKLFFFFRFENELGMNERRQTTTTQFYVLYVYRLSIYVPYRRQDADEIISSQLIRGYVYRPRLNIARVRPGKILSPFLEHSTFTVRLQMVNSSGYGELGHHQYSLKWPRLNMVSIPSFCCW